MSRALIELAGEDVLCSLAEGGSELRLPYAAASDRLAAWSARYDAAAARDVEAELRAIGREMFTWLDDSDWASGWADEAGDRDLEIRVRRRDDGREIALLDAPWELLARDSGPLALDEAIRRGNRRTGPSRRPAGFGGRPVRGGGETDEALRVRQEEQLPVYERLGDVRSRAINLQQIAAALIATGGLEGASKKSTMRLPRP